MKTSILDDFDAISERLKEISPNSASIPKAVIQNRDGEETIWVPIRKDFEFKKPLVLRVTIKKEDLQNWAIVNLNTNRIYMYNMETNEWCEVE